MAMLSIKEFPDEVYKALKIRAVQEGKTLRELVIELLTKISQGDRRSKMGSIYKKKYKNKEGELYEGNVWWIKYYRNGKPFQRKLKLH